MATSPHTPLPRIARVYAAVNIGSFRVSAMIMGQGEDGEMVVLGSSHRKAEGIKRGYVTDMTAASHAIRAVVEKAEASANTSVSGVWIACAGAGLGSRVSKVEIPIDGRRIVSQDWLDQSTAPSAPTEDGKIGYGYQWWIPKGAEPGISLARGIYGQYIFVDPDRNVVIVTNAADRQFREDGVDEQNIAMFRKIAESL